MSTVRVLKLPTKCESFLYFAFSDKVQSLVYSTASKQLLSSGDDCIISFWDMDAKRQEVSILRNIYSQFDGTKNYFSKFDIIPIYGL